jgi:hypothetical protein
MENKMSQEDIATMTMFISEGIRENGIAPLGYEMLITCITDDSVSIEFTNSTGKFRAFKIKLEILTDDDTEKIYARRRVRALASFS